MDPATGPAHIATGNGGTITGEGSGSGSRMMTSATGSISLTRRGRTRRVRRLKLHFKRPIAATRGLVRQQSHIDIAGFQQPGKMLVTGKHQQLMPTLGKLDQYVHSGCGAFLIEIHQHVVQHHWQRNTAAGEQAN